MIDIKEKISDLERTILAPIIYWDIFERPLTLLEIWKYLYSDKERDNLKKRSLYTIFQVQQALENNKLRNIVSLKEGFYFLKGRDNLVNKRSEKERRSIDYWKEAKASVKLISFLPFVKQIYVVSNLAQNNVNNKSDIDILVVAKRNKLYFTRALIYFWLKILGKKRTPRNFIRKICLSFFISEESLNLESLKLDQDPYLALWIKTAILVLDHSKRGNRLIEENAWINDYFINSKYSEELSNLHSIKINRFFSYLKNLSELVLIPLSLLLEGPLKLLQIKVYNKYKVKNIPTAVVLNKRFIKLFPTDCREEVLKKFEEKIIQVVT